MSGYYSLVPSYVIVAKGLTLENTSVGGAVYGATGMAGVLSMAAISFVDFNRVLPHSILPVIGGAAIALLTMANEEVNENMPQRYICVQLKLSLLISFELLLKLKRIKTRCLIYFNLKFFG